MIRTDTILRLIEQCVDLILQATGLKKAVAVEQELAGAVSAWTGLDLDLAIQWPTETLIGLLGAAPMGAEERILLVGQAVAIRCLIARQRGELAEALPLQQKAERLIEEALRRRPDLDGEKLQAMLAALYG